MFSDCQAMHLQGMWHEFMAAAGNMPGANKGDVVITLVQPVAGISELTVPSGSVSIAAEAGNLIGLQVMMPDGRRLFVNSGNLAGFVDAPRGEAEAARRSLTEQGGAGEDLDEDKSPEGTPGE